MKQLKWHLKHGTKFETYNVLYEDETFILVQNDNTKKYSFGAASDFGSLYGFPVDQSCLTQDEARNILNDFIEIDKRSIAYPFANKNISRWKNMILQIN